jgi:hypothetical protein
VGTGNLGAGGEELVLIGFWATILATCWAPSRRLACRGRKCPIAGDHGAADLADDRADHHHRGGDVLLLRQGLRAPIRRWAIFGMFLSEKGCLANSHLGVIVAHAVLGIPFVIITVTATLSGFDQSLIRAAHSLGATRAPPSSRWSCR